LGKEAQISAGDFLVLGTEKYALVFQNINPKRKSTIKTEKQLSESTQM
jgi:hypothetical protein